MREDVKVCSRCVLPATFPTIEFDGSGTCNYCRGFVPEKQQEAARIKHRSKFEDLLRARRGLNDYDVIMAFSGGKDSTYTLDMFKNTFGLRVLAVSFDHGFLSPYAIDNIRRVVENLSVDHIFFKPGFEVLKKLFLISLKANLFSKKSLERASTICSSCMYLIKAITIKLAIEKRVPFIGYGWSPGQAPIQSSVMRNSGPLLLATQSVVFDALHAELGDQVRQYFIDPEVLSSSELLPYNVHPLAFMEYDEERIFRRIRELGWEHPADTDSNSTNCLLNSFANQVHLEKFGFHPYAFEMAGLVRMGIIERGEALGRLGSAGDPAIIGMVKTKLGLS